jgi:hypothetical protein
LLTEEVTRAAIRRRSMIDTIELYERKMIDELALRLGTGSYR